MRTYLTSVVAALMVLGAPLVASSRGSAPFPIGTYRFQLCRAHCSLTDTATAFAIGRLVLADSTFQNDIPNGCYRYDLRRASEDSYSYAALQPLGFFQAGAQSGDSIRFVLFTSIDASSEATIAADGDTLRGQVVSEGGRAIVDPTWVPDQLLAVRIGPPDMRICRR